MVWRGVCNGVHNCACSMIAQNILILYDLVAPASLKPADEQSSQLPAALLLLPLPTTGPSAYASASLSTRCCQLPAAACHSLSSFIMATTLQTLARLGQALIWGRYLQRVSRRVSIPYNQGLQSACEGGTSGVAGVVAL